MADFYIKPSILSGVIKAPPSKSVAHRAILCAALAGDPTLAVNCQGQISKDILATCNAIGDLLAGKQELFCNESGSTLRFLIPIAAALGRETVFTGAGRLSERPLDEYRSILKDKGVTLEFPEKGSLPLHIKGKLNSGEFPVPGNVSSQYITGLLLALPLLDGNSKVIVEGELESSAYVDLTIHVMHRFGVTVERLVNGYFIGGNQKYLRTHYSVEGDYSQAAFWAVANYLGSNIDIQGLDPSSAQGDKKIYEILRELDKINDSAEVGTKTPHRDLLCDILGIKGEKAVFEIDASQIPDLIPVICVAAVNTNAITRIVNAGRLRYKESDRIKTSVQLIKGIGGTVSEEDNGLVIYGSHNLLEGGEIDSYGDHRIAMAGAVAALKTQNGVLIRNADCVDKSYPNFFEDLRSAGGIIDEFYMGKQA
jgi:3-phosphoshikimate 1-carboxyvinyltransferase